MGAGVEVFGEAAGDEAAELGPGAGGEDLDEVIGVRVGDGDQAIPDEQGKVVILGVLGVGNKSDGEVLAKVEGETLEGGGELEADLGGLGGEFYEGGEILLGGGDGFGGVDAGGGDGVEGPSVREQLNVGSWIRFVGDLLNIEVFLHW